MGLFVSNVIATQSKCTHGDQKKFHHVLLISSEAIIMRSMSDHMIVTEVDGSNGAE